MIDIYVPRNFISFILCLSIINKKNKNFIFLSKSYFTKYIIKIFNQLAHNYNYKIILFDFNFYDSKIKIYNNNIKLNKIIKKKFNLYSCGFPFDQIIKKNKLFNNNYYLICHGFGTFINYKIENSFIYKLYNLIKFKKIKTKGYDNYFTYFNSKVISLKMKKIISNVSNKILKNNNLLNQIYFNNKNKKFIFLNISFKVKLSNTEETTLFNLLTKNLDRKKYFLIKSKFDPYLSSKSKNKILMLEKFKKFLIIKNFKFLSIENPKLVSLPIEIYANLFKLKFATGEITSSFFSLSKIFKVKILNAFIIPKIFDAMFRNSNESKLLYIFLYNGYYNNIKFSKINL